MNVLFKFHIQFESQHVCATFFYQIYFTIIEAISVNRIDRINRFWLKDSLWQMISAFLKSKHIFIILTLNFWNIWLTSTTICQQRFFFSAESKKNNISKPLKNCFEIQKRQFKQLSCNSYTKFNSCNQNKAKQKRLNAAKKRGVSF